MTKLETVRNKLDKKLFNSGAVLLSSVTISSYIEGSASYGGYSDADSTYAPGVSYAAVLYNNIPSQFKIQPFGDFQTGDSYLALRYDTPIKIKDKVTYLSNNYFVQEIKEIPVNDGIAVKIVQIRLKH